MKKSWYRFENLANADESTLFIYDEIGLWGVSAKDFAADLSTVKAKTINIRINSPGGDVFDGFSIHNSLKAHPATVKVQVDGLAASIASIIAMAGDEISMARNAFLMVHNSWALTAGNAEDMRKLADTLDKIDVQLMKTYTDRTGKTQRDIKQLMADETWLNADEAVAGGFADKICDPAQISNKFDLTKFNRVPQAVAAMNMIATPEMITEREMEQNLRDSGFSKKQALTAVAAIRADTRRDSDQEIIDALTRAASETRLIAAMR